MVKLLTLTSKQAFLALFKFGSMPLHQEYCIEYSTLIELKESQDQLKQLFSPHPGIEFIDDYLFLCWELSNKPQSWHEASIKNLKKIIPLTEEAKNSLVLKMDERIYFEDAWFEGFINSYLFDQRFSDSRTGGEKILEYFGLDSHYSQFFESDKLKQALNCRIKGNKSFEIEHHNFLSALITYDRYESFPKFSALGFIYDTLKLLADWKGHTMKHGEKAYRESKTYKFFEERREELENLKTVDLLEYIDSFSEQPLSKYKKHFSMGDLKLWSLAYFFLRFKEDFRESGGLNKANLSEKINHIVEHGKFVQELVQAVYLLGFFFGYSKIYSDYYDVIKLLIFKHTVRDRKPDVVSQEEYISENSHSEIQLDKEDISQPKTEKKKDSKKVDAVNKDDWQSKYIDKEPTLFDSNLHQPEKNKLLPIDSIKKILDENGKEINFNQLKTALTQRGVRIDGKKPTKKNIKPIIKDSNIQIRGSGSDEELYIEE